ncbi:MAG: hypothetical protein EBR82_29125 [Caulobacteraceae bacterium]|nr:hypothetical protein [Caulobacteraceae bacterium]
MTEPTEDIYGANLPIFEKLKLLAEWAPLLGRLQAIASAKTPYDQSLAVISAIQWAAGKSNTELDDEALFHLEAVLRTSEGKALFDWAASKVTA